jgi:hypothetical protein
MMMLTGDQVNEMFKEAKVVFRSYWKYVFTFEGEQLGYEIIVRYGGNSEDIYRYDVDDNPVTFNSVQDWDEVVIKSSKGEEVFRYHYL